MKAEHSERLAGPTEEMLLNLPDELLRGLSAAYIETLPAELRAKLRARIGR